MRAVYTPGISERASGTSKFYHTDALGSTRGITNGSQTVTDAVLYDGFGMTVSRTGSTATPFGFVGAAQYQSDADSGLQLLGHRMYDPSVGRFISSDPIQDGDNWYAYCQNNPLVATDPMGLQAPPSGWYDDGNGNATGPGEDPRQLQLRAKLAGGMLGRIEAPPTPPAIGVIFPICPVMGGVGEAGGIAGTILKYLGRIMPIPTVPPMQYRKPPSADKLRQKPWLKDGRYNTGPHIDEDPGGNHGGPHIDIPIGKTGGNYRVPLPGNKLYPSEGPIK